MKAWAWAGWVVAGALVTYAVVAVLAGERAGMRAIEGARRVC